MLKVLNEVFGANVHPERVEHPPLARSGKSHSVALRAHKNSDMNAISQIAAHTPKHDSFRWRKTKAKN